MSFTVSYWTGDDSVVLRLGTRYPSLRWTSFVTPYLRTAHHYNDADQLFLASVPGVSSLSGPLLELIRDALAEEFDLPPDVIDKALRWRQIETKVLR